MRKNPVERASGLELPTDSGSIPTCSSEIFSVAPSSVAKQLPLRHFLHKCLRHQFIFQIKRLLVTSRLTVLLKYLCMIVNIERLRFFWVAIFFYLSWLQSGTKRIDFYKSFSAQVLVLCTSKYKKVTSRPVKGHLIKVCFQLKPNLVFIPYSVPVLWQLPFKVSCVGGVRCLLSYLALSQGSVCCFKADPHSPCFSLAGGSFPPLSSRN